MVDWTCQFCGSTKRMVERLLPDGSPLVQLGKNGEYEPVLDICCQSQKRNVEYVKSHTNRQTGEAPDIDEVGSL